MKKDEPRCCAEIQSDYRFYQCGHKGKVQRGGKWYCGRHDPEKVALRKKKREEKWQAESKVNKEKWARHAAVYDACEGIPTDQLRPGLLKELLDAKP